MRARSWAGSWGPLSCGQELGRVLEEGPELRQKLTLQLLDHGEVGEGRAGVGKFTPAPSEVFQYFHSSSSAVAGLSVCLL